MRNWLHSWLSRNKKVERDLSFGLIDQLGIPVLVRTRRWPDVEEVAARLSADELSRLLDGLCLHSKYEQEIGQLEQHTASEFTRLVLGARYLYQAWEARTGKWGAELSEQEVNGFQHYLSLAQAQLSAPFEDNNYRCEARAKLVRVEMGLSDPEAAVTAYQEAVAVEQTKFWAYHHMFKLLSPKWLGDEDELVSFVQSVEDTAVHYALWLMFLVEMYSDAETENERTAQQVWYAKYRKVIEQVLALPTIEVDDSLVSIYANNNLAYVYHLVGDKPRRDALLNQLGERFSPYPWAYFGIESESTVAMKKFRDSAACPKPC